MQQQQIKILEFERKRARERAYKLDIDVLDSTLRNYEDVYANENNSDTYKRRAEVFNEIRELRTILFSQAAAKTRKDTFAKRFWWVSRKILEPPTIKKALRACYNGLVKLVSWFKPRARSWFWKKSSTEKLSSDLLKKVTPLCFKRRATI